MRQAAFAFTALAAFALTAGAQEVTFQVTPPGAELKLTDKFKVKVQASLPETYTIIADTASADATDFELLSLAQTGDFAADGRRTLSFELTAQAFALGPSSFPVLYWDLVQAGSPSSRVKSPGFELDIKPLFETEEGDNSIRDIYPPFKFPPWLLLALAAAALIEAARRLYNKYKATEAVALAAAWKDTRPPYQRALDRIDRLAGTPLVGSGKMKEYYIGLTSILRFYLYEEFALKAELMTTSDLARELKSTGADLRTSLKTREFLQKADLVKFARLRPENAESDTTELRELVGDFTRAMERKRAAAEAATQAAGGGRP